MWLLLLLVGCSRTSDEAAPEAREESPSCLTWLDAPRALSPTRPEPRHHPTAVWTSEGLLAAWQVGKSPAFVAVRAFDPDLVPQGREGRINALEARATHPQVASRGEGVSLLWTDESDGELRWRALDALGEPVEGAHDLRQPGDPRRGLYGDVSTDAQGTPHAMWFAGDEPVPVWRVARLDANGITRWDLPVAAGTNAGGPGTLRRHGDDLWVAWPERHGRAGGGGQATVRLARVSADGPTHPIDLLRRDDNLQRLALGFADDHVVVGWTRYPTEAAPWGAGLAFGSLAGADVRVVELPGTAARMTHLDALDGAVVVGWDAAERPTRRAVHLAVYDADGTLRCGPVAAGGDPDEDQGRAHVQLVRRDDGLHGVLLWQQGPGSRTRVLARRFQVTASAP